MLLRYKKHLNEHRYKGTSPKTQAMRETETLLAINRGPGCVNYTQDGFIHIAASGWIMLH